MTLIVENNSWLKLLSFEFGTQTHPLPLSLLFSFSKLSPTFPPSPQSIPSPSKLRRRLASNKTQRKGLAYSVDISVDFSKLLDWASFGKQC
jgi:hypothetical protein